MRIEKIFLQNFRSYQEKTFVFGKGISLIVGSNASGKTNLLEAIYLLARGRSFRAKLEAEMISYGKEMSNVKCSHLVPLVGGASRDKQILEIILTTGEVMGKKVAKKIYKINGVNRRMLDFVGNLRCVYFGPEDLEIVVNSPSTRRDYLDSVLEQVDREYRRASLSYKKGLRQRNRLLEQIRDQGRPRSILFFWDKLLIENGEVITKKREELINFVNIQPEYFGKLHISYDKSVISPQRLEMYAEKEVGAGMTLVGPHRDDFQVNIEEGEPRKSRNLSIYGSRGEQRTAVFSLKLAELEFVSQKTESALGRVVPFAEVATKAESAGKPVLLLDDIFSELDHERRERLLEVIPKQQTIITTTDLHLVELEYRKRMEIVKI